MRILFDNDAPNPLRHYLKGHTVITAAEKDWHRLKNGDLLNAAETEGFDLLVTADKGFQYQQSIIHRNIGIVILGSGQWPDIRLNIDRVLDAIDSATPGHCRVAECVIKSFGRKKPHGQ